ncbi:ATP-dependent DNA helicase RecG [Clostridium septicum]|uniref:ATP-dependent DNA helicase RecG n=1 Tax=Clostridium septicum TaxID=1504 RepID=A0A9N7JJI6_CLOSE|nr:ATP-dependent DNA helicase RecG [Clostridium septicum]AYE33111.1 DNA helicase RecG [Clostridium septicum]MDU1313481.1 ATP-dependent DNA helicase RecG [Clostridium septicum]QAS61281.1 ATP-dependent DNA helicase RecG [Clostridium septicum]UEC19368.1 ATP-dependent DNA helicase RecG [Clostridium septicum]USR99679.1 ATP-dependent DNA helicase RecG [Clostridium septicum]
MNISEDISSVKGVGPKLTERLNKCGIFTILDLLLYFPRDYEFIRGNISFQEIDENEKQILSCKVIEFGKDIKTKTGKTISTINFHYMGHLVQGKWFNQKYIKSSYRIGETYDLVGKFKKIGSKLEIINPIIGCKEAKNNEIIPKYPLKGDLTDRILTKLINQVLQEIIITENLPKDLIEKYNLYSLDKAIRNIHFPSGKNELDMSITRLKFQELFTYSMKLLLLKNKLRSSKGINFKWVDELKDLKESLPFQLTEAQTKVVREILRDQKSIYSMNRLVQGDVGSGKTIVALIAMFNVVKNGYQASLMVPTEILANQHYEEAKKLFENFNVDIELLTGSTSLKEKRRIKEKISSDKAFIVIGTHALIQEDVEFKNLGLVITDEQHRFGVEQRSKLINKGRRPDVLVMTATPIPRTLALYLYSDLDVSIIDKLPPGRKKIDTKFFNDDKRNLAYELALSEINKGRQVYIVCPLIEEDEKLELNSVEKLFSELKSGVFKDTTIEILHGKMKAKEKDEIINRFKENKTKLIISTTVIEVGVNVPNASVMIIENSERFGLAQLHQLRGRVGRGEYESYCILIGKAKSKITKKRMEIMTESTDGFYISEEDLKLRGSGEMFGLRQSGDEGLILADIYEDINILRCARGEANRLLNSKEIEAIRICKEIAKSIERWSRYICFN